MGADAQESRHRADECRRGRRSSQPVSLTPISDEKAHAQDVPRVRLPSLQAEPEVEPSSRILAQFSRSPGAQYGEPRASPTAYLSGEDDREKEAVEATDAAQ